MTAPTLTTFEQALLDRLEDQLHVSNGGPFRAIEPYEGQLADLIQEEGFDGPQCWVYIDKGDESWHTESSLDRELEVHLFVAASNYRGSKARRHGSGAAEFGTYQLIDSILATLGGHDLDLEMQPLRPLGFHSIVAPEMAVKLRASVYRYDWFAKWTGARPDIEPAAVDHETSRGTIQSEAGADGAAELETETEHT